ncbi:uncharacterized protein LOC124261058 [Haliotis rubra]|uniref:uncharacterized protein LOC124261058 n=1 Tax=Haliotis rubra TaxID=36100 RepID=UPI001EE5A790|nr:uncharacterized protein LOC124261058 [Haliotis rubra]
MPDHDYANPPTSTADQLESLKQYTKKLEDQLAAVCSKRFGINRFTHDQDLIQFYTGFRTYDDFISTFNALKPTAVNMVRWSQVQRHRSSNAENPQIKSDIFRDESIPLIDQFFMFLCRIRQGFFEVDLAVRFDVSVSSVSRILVTWANYLYVMLGMLPIWQERAAINKVMPECFKSTYPNTRVILDCTEIRVQTPSSKTRNSEMYSHYKSHSTMKGLIGITPDGMISFVSALYTGSVSDKEITKQCGILDLLDVGDDVMADKGFVIQDLLTPKGAKLIIPPFLREKGQFSRREVKETQEIARLRIHIERAIRRCKEYHIFDSVIPLTLAGSINQVWTVCCLLTNFYGKLF